jgi:GrpB-like predicted nucleotidyltransferase (UPF0157 family)
MNRPHAPLSDRIAELTREEVSIVPHDPRWADMYAMEEAHLIRSLPPSRVKRIAHIGSTAVPGLRAKPIVDIQVEVDTLDHVHRDVVPIMEQMGYEFIWRPTIGEQTPFYAWFIKRGSDGKRTHHVHMVEPDKASSDRIRFRDILRAHPHLAAKYETLKQAMADRHAGDRAAYTASKTPFIQELLNNHPS